MNEVVEVMKKELNESPVPRDILKAKGQSTELSSNSD